jgi:hypothetical protein
MTGQAKLVTGEALAGLFELFSDSVECVVLNGCYSQIQAETIAQHIPYVIGMPREISDRFAIIFAVGFYDALGAGRSFDFSYKLGCNAIRMEGVREHFKPVLINGKNSKITDLEYLDTTTSKKSYIELFKKCSSMDELLKVAIHSIENITKTDYNQVLLSVFEGHSSYLAAVVFAISPHKQRYIRATFDGLLGKAFTSGKVLNIPNVSNESCYFAAVFETKSELVIPIRNENSVIGVINSESEELAHYDAEICRQIDNIASALGEMLPVFGWSSSSTREFPRISLLPKFASSG